MAEIKSTLDLIMEKTKHLVLSEEEKKTAEREEQLKKTPGYVQKFLDGIMNVHQLESELEQFPADLRDPMTRKLTEQFLKEVDLGEKGEKCLQALDFLATNEHRIWLDQLKKLILTFEEKKTKWMPVHEEEMKRKLAHMGIQGDAVVVRPEKSRQWQIEKRSFQTQLREVQAAWQSALGET